MSTPELLAKREQRRRMEAQAAALSRPSLSRRLLLPVQNSGAAQHQQPQHQPNSVAGLAPQQTSRSVFSRAGLKRPAPAAKAAAPAPTAYAGISAEDLAKVRSNSSPAVVLTLLGMSCCFCEQHSNSILEGHWIVCVCVSSMS